MTMITIFHNPACGTSRNTLALIRNSGVVLDILPHAQQGPFTKEDGEVVINKQSQRV